MLKGLQRYGRGKPDSERFNRVQEIECADGGVFVSREFLQKMDGYDDFYKRNYSDNEFGLRARKKEIKVIYNAHAKFWVEAESSSERDKKKLGTEAIYSLFFLLETL